MILDHVNAVFYARELGTWAEIIGRLAMPLFAGVFGYNLARPGADVARALRRLVLVGILATPAYAGLFGLVGIWPGNILLTFAVAAWVILELEQDRPGRALAAFLLGGALVEFWWPGVGLVVACWIMASSSRPWLHLPAVLACLAALCVVVNGNAWAALSVPLAAFLVAVDPRVPRLAWVFWWIYPVHLVALWILAQL